MPGIITHNKIFKDSIKLLSTRKKKSFLLKSISSLFTSEEFITAGLFGSIGPNIFDYIPVRSKNNYYGNEISFFLHDGGADKLVDEFIRKVYSSSDKNNECSAMQRAYLYGFISHMVSDSIIHPFVFYFSGFPEVFDKKRIYYFRKQNLLFQYNIDNYYQFYEDSSKSFDYSIDKMLPFKSKNKIYRMNPSIKNFILSSIHEVYPEIFKKITFYTGKDEDEFYSRSFGHLDLVPYFLKMSYKIKKTQNKKFLKYLNDLTKKNMFFSDFFVAYPWPKRLNNDALNLHRERWQFPAGKSGYRYDSIDGLVQLACEKTVELWEKIEQSLYKKEDKNISKEFQINGYTGEEKANYYDLKISNPKRI